MKMSELTPEEREEVVAQCGADGAALSEESIKMLDEVDLAPASRSFVIQAINQTAAAYLSCQRILGRLVEPAEQERALMVFSRITAVRFQRTYEGTVRLLGPLKARRQS